MIGDQKSAGVAIPRLNINLSLLLLTIIGFAFLGNQRLTWPLLDILVMLIFVDMCLRPKNYFISPMALSCMGLAICLALANMLGHAPTTVSFIKLYYYLRPILILLFLNMMIATQREQLLRFLKVLCWVATLHFWINFPYIFEEYLSNPSDIDNLTGLAGVGSTHSLAVLWILTLSLQLYFRYSKALLAVEVLLMAYAGAVSDNKLFFVLLLLFGSWAAFRKGAGAASRNTLLTRASVLAVVLGVAVYYLISPDEGAPMQRIIGKLVYFVTHPDAPNSERLFLLAYVLKLPEVYGLGYGLGALADIAGYRGYAVGDVLHLNMTDILVMTFEMGLLGALSFIILYGLLTPGWKLFSGFERAIALLSVGLMIFSALFVSDPRIFIYFCLFLAVMALGSFRAEAPRNWRYV